MATLTVSPVLQPNVVQHERSWTTPAVVLKTMAYSDTSQIITLYTPDRGRVGTVVKGARSPKSKSAGVCLPLNYGEVQLYKGKTLHTLSQYQPLASFPRLRQDFEALNYGLFAVQLIDTLTTEHDDESATIFETLVECLQALDSGELPAVVVAVMFQAKLLEATGYWPNLTHCVATEAPMIETSLLPREALGDSRLRGNDDKIQNDSATMTPWVAFSPEWGGVVSAMAARSIPPTATGQRRWVKVSTSTLTCLHQVQNASFNSEFSTENLIHWEKAMRFLAYYAPTQVEGSQRAYRGLEQVGLLNKP